MTSTAPAPPQMLRSASDEPRIRLRQFDTADVGWLAGSAVSAFCLGWLLYERLTPLSGGLGFWLCWYVLFVAMYGLIVRDTRGPLAARDRVAGVVMTTAGLILVVTLVFIVGYVVVKGVSALRAQFFFDTQEGISAESGASDGGGAQAIVGTLEQVGIAVLLSVPLAVACAVFLNEIGGPLVRPVRLIVDAMSGLPSIVAGLFIWATWVLALGRGQSGVAVALALSVLMLPTVTRTAEVVLRLVPGGLREGALALGGTEWRMTRLVVLPTARSGLVTAVILGVARAIGETAPLLLLASAVPHMEWNPFEDQDSLPYMVFRLILFPQEAQVQRAWTGALVLLLTVLVLFVAARLIGSRRPGGQRIWTRMRRRSAVA
jgi:phosphate transport system permease protein